MINCSPTPPSLADFDDVPTAEQFAAINELVRPVDETDGDEALSSWLSCLSAASSIWAGTIGGRTWTSSLH